MNNLEEIPPPPPPPPRTPQPDVRGFTTSTPEQDAAVRLVSEGLQPVSPRSPDGPPVRDLRQVPSFYIPNN